MDGNGFIKPVLTLLILLIGISLIIGGRRGPAKLLGFIFSPGISCLKRIVQAVLAITFLSVVLFYGIPHVFAPGGVHLPEPPTSDTQPDSISLDVPFNSQRLPISGMKNNICGYASLSMAAGYVRGFKPSMETNVKILDFLELNPDGQELSTTGSIIRAGKGMYDLDLQSGRWSIDEIKEEVASGHPVIAGIRAGDIPRSIRGYDYTGGHYLVVIGYDQNNVIVNDPGTRNGNAKRYPNIHFEKAFSAEGSSVIFGFRR